MKTSTKRDAIRRVGWLMALITRCEMSESERQAALDNLATIEMALESIPTESDR